MAKDLELSSKAGVLNRCAIAAHDHLKKFDQKYLFKVLFSNLGPYSQNFLGQIRKIFVTLDLIS